MIKRLFLLLLVITIAATKLHAADEPFIGKWKLNPNKSTLHDQMKVTSAGPNRYAFDFGSGPEFIVVNGTDQPGLEGTTLAVTKEAAHLWKVVRKKNGRMQISAVWTLSSNGRSLRDDFTGYQPDGSSYTIHYIYSPIGGASGFAAIWDSTSEKPEPFNVEIQSYQNEGLAFINKTEHSTKKMKFDGKDYRVEDANTSVTTISSARRINTSTLEFTEKRAGKVADIQHIHLSPDGKTLTMTIQPASRHMPDILVFDRQ